MDLLLHLVLGVNGLEGGLGFVGDRALERVQPLGCLLLHLAVLAAPDEDLDAGLRLEQRRPLLLPIDGLCLVHLVHPLRPCHVLEGVEDRPEHVHHELEDVGVAHAPHALDDLKVLQIRLHLLHHLVLLAPLLEQVSVGVLDGHEEFSCFGVGVLVRVQPLRVTAKGLLDRLLVREIGHSENLVVSLFCADAKDFLEEFHRGFRVELLDGLFTFGSYFVEQDVAGEHRGEEERQVEEHGGPEDPGPSHLFANGFGSKA
mmetsp:Transcript_13019/g.32902  ORF Transcript_13019/g.32902 Transcript_13019/m.32902 type:complete len:258 (-) Transcript_13019:480-1253(-)